MELRILLYMPYIYCIFCQCFCLSLRCLSLFVLSPSLQCLYNVTVLQLVNMTLFKVLQGGWQCTEEINLAAYRSTCSSICFYPMTMRQLCRQRAERYWETFIDQLLRKKYRKNIYACMHRNSKHAWSLGIYILQVILRFLVCKLTRITNCLLLRDPLHNFFCDFMCCHPSWQPFKGINIHSGN